MEKNYLKTPLIIFSFLCLALVLINSRFDYSWDDWRPASCTASTIGCFCEKAGDGLLRQPVNTYSSLSFTLLGFIIFNRVRRDVKIGVRKNMLSTKLIYGAVFAASLALTGLGSAFYHASLSFAGQTIDVLGMYFTVSFILMYNILRSCCMKESHAAVLYIIINTVLSCVLIFFPGVRRYIFAFFLILSLLLELRYQREKRHDIKSKYLLLAFFIILISFCIWILDAFKILCSPESLIQGHGIWHIGGAVSVWFLYLYYRSENVV
ncbi:MAG: ceramidase domain-containing protein [Spirochaetales bacterium]|nr:ceramidase domain-containing protein [Spirochaetales bacterium]